MTDEASRPKLAHQLVMTPQLQLAIKLLSTRDFPIAEWKQQFPGLAELPAGERDPLDVEEEAADRDPALVAWFPATESPLPALAEPADVWLHGNPPQARANRHAYPRLGATTPEARWLLRALRQRARTYERVVQAIADLRPQLAVTLDPEQVEPVAIDTLATAIGLHASTIERVAQACRFQNLHHVVGLVRRGSRLGFAKL